MKALEMFIYFEFYQSCKGVLVRVAVSVICGDHIRRKCHMVSTRLFSGVKLSQWRLCQLIIIIVISGLSTCFYVRFVEMSLRGTQMLRSDQKKHKSHCDLTAIFSSLDRHKITCV